ncbi:MAG: hypothetical protein Q9221_006234 [Calogaya cf. arnoldii]
MPKKVPSTKREPYRNVFCRPMDALTSIRGHEPYKGAAPLMYKYPAKFDPPPPHEPRNIPIPDNPRLVTTLNDYDKDQVDFDYMGFIIVMERIWEQFLRGHFEDFCYRQGPLSIRKETVAAEVTRVMRIWADKIMVLKEFPHAVEEVRDVSHVEYEWRVRQCHVGQHLEEYVESTVLRLRNLGYLIGG